MYGGSVKGLSGGAAGIDVRPRVTVGQSDQQKGRGVSEQIVTKNIYPDGTTHAFSRPALADLQNGNGAQAAGVAVGSAKGWHLAADAMGIDWMKRHELTQAIPPCMTEHIGRQLMALLGAP